MRMLGITIVSTLPAKSFSLFGGVVEKASNVKYAVDVSHRSDAASINKNCIKTTAVRQKYIIRLK